MILQQLENGQKGLGVQVARAQACGVSSAQAQEVGCGQHRADLGPGPLIRARARPHRTQKEPARLDVCSTVLAAPPLLAAPQRPKAGATISVPDRSNKQEIWPAGLDRVSAVAQAVSSTYTISRLVWARSRRRMSCLDKDRPGWQARCTGR